MIFKTQSLLFVKRETVCYLGDGAKLISNKGNFAWVLNGLFYWLTVSLFVGEEKDNKKKGKRIIGEEK